MDTTNWGTPIEISSGADAAPDRFAGLAVRARASQSVHLRTVAAGLVMVGFVLAAASQVLPWMTVGGNLGAESDLGPISGREFAAADGASVLLFAYDVLWLPILALCGACVFSAGRRQRVLFAAAAGSLAAQTMIMLPMLAKPGRIIGEVALFDNGTLRATRGAGAWFAVAAMVLFAGAVVLAVGGRVLPTEVAEPRPAPVYDGYPPEPPPVEAPPVDMHAALAASQSYQREPDIDYGAAPPPHTDMYRPQPGPEHDRPAADHSMYVRPREAEENRA